MSTPLPARTYRMVSTVPFHVPWMRMGVSRLRVRTYEKPRSKPSAVSCAAAGARACACHVAERVSTAWRSSGGAHPPHTCVKSRGVRCTSPKATEDTATAAGVGMYLVSDTSKKPRNTVSSSTGASTEVVANRAK